MKPHKHRSQEQWQLLIKEQQSSGLNAAEFCRQKDLNAKYFSKRKRELLAQHGRVEHAPFIRLEQSEKPAVADFVMQYQGVRLQMHLQPEASWVPQLIKALS